MAYMRSTGQEAGKINVYKTKRSITERGERERERMREEDNKGREERGKMEEEQQESQSILLG